MKDIDEEKKILKKKLQERENKGYIYIIISQLLLSLNIIHIKAIITFFSDTFTINSLIFYSNITLLFFCFVKCKLKRELNVVYRLKNFSKNFWFFVKFGTSYLLIASFVAVNINYRVSTCESIKYCNSIIVLMIAVLLFKEKFYFRYLMGAAACLIGIILIILNETNSIYRIIIAIVYLLLLSINHLANDKLVINQISNDENIFWNSIFTCLPAFMFLLIQKNIVTFNSKYLLHTVIYAITFYLSKYFYTEAFNYIPKSNLIPFIYLPIIIIYIPGYIILGEKVYVTDIIGIILIITFELINFYIRLSSK
jgi:drug/metabolite transporter (DMT)-like permease